MIVGLPGAGISAFFYLILILLMPVRLGWQAVRRTGVRGGQLRLIARQLTIGGGILGSFVVIGWVLATVLPIQTQGVDGGDMAVAAAAVERGAAQVGVYLGLATLVAVLIGTQLLAMSLRRRTAPN